MARTTDIQFPGDNGVLLQGTLVEPDSGQARAWAMFTHCFTCHRKYKVAVNVSRVLADMGWGVFRFDFTGLGDSAGRFEDTNFSTNVQDVLAAARHLTANYGAPELLVGHSLGGAACVVAAKQLESVRCIATIATPFRQNRLARLFSEENLAVWAEAPEQVEQVVVSGRPMPFKAQFLEDLKQHESEVPVADLKLPLLIFHSPADKTTSIRNAEGLFAAANHPKSFVSLGDADHLVSKREDAEMIGRVIAAWAERYLH